MGHNEAILMISQKNICLISPKNICLAWFDAVSHDHIMIHFFVMVNHRQINPFAWKAPRFTASNAL